MKRFATLFLILSCLVAAASADPVKIKSKSEGKETTTTIQLSGRPADGPMGLGLFLGQPSGITFELDVAETSWLDFKAAWDFASARGGYSIMLQGNYELAFPGMIMIETESFTPFVGAGAFAMIYDGGAAFGLRVPGGLSYRFRTVPLELFLEAGLDVSLFPGFGLGASGGLGVRYRF